MFQKFLQSLDVFPKCIFFFPCNMDLQFLLEMAYLKIRVRNICSILFGCKEYMKKTTFPREKWNRILCGNSGAHSKCLIGNGWNLKRCENVGYDIIPTWTFDNCLTHEQSLSSLSFFWSEEPSYFLSISFFLGIGFPPEDHVAGILEIPFWWDSCTFPDFVCFVKKNKKKLGKCECWSPNSAQAGPKPMHP